MTVEYTPEFVERGYNNRAAVPEHPQWFAKYAAWSLAARDRYQPARDLRYGENPLETLDLFVPAARCPRQRCRPRRGEGCRDCNKLRRDRV